MLNGGEPGSHFVFLEWRKEIPDFSVGMANTFVKAGLADCSCLAPLKGVARWLLVARWPQEVDPRRKHYTESSILLLGDLSYRSTSI